MMNWKVYGSGPKNEEVAGLHNEELYNLCASPNMNMMINSREMRWAGRVARMR
jgi:hypothetical protein